VTHFPAALALVAALLAPLAAGAQTTGPAAAPAAPAALIDQCVAEMCKARLTAEQLLNEIQVLVLAQRYKEAEPMLAALSQVPELRFETRFLTGMVEAGTGNHAAAIEQYKAILAADPNQTRVRLELGKSMLALGHTASADRQFALAQRDDELPDDVASTIRLVRDVLRARRAWRLNVDFGIAPDSNINNATSADSVTILWGGQPLPIQLDQNAKPRSGTGQTASIAAGARLPVGEHVSALVDLDSAGTNYSGTAYDDFQAQAAAGMELRISRTAAVSLQGVGAQRWFSGRLVSRQLGAKTGFQARLSNTQQIGFQIDARKTDALFDPAYDGWQAGAYLTYEKAVSKSLVVSLGGFARRDWLKADAYSSTELGAIAGFGGELPLGISFGLSGSVSRAKFDDIIPLFSLEPRKDWRLTGRATLGNRKIDLWGFSPQVSVSYSRIDSSIRYYDNDRLRLRFAAVRYF
jgi:tetratricopeptide (TPR) repeat protein